MAGVPKLRPVIKNLVRPASTMQVWLNQSYAFFDPA